MNVETLANLADLCDHSAGVGAVAGEHFNRDRTVIGGTQQAIDDLHLAAFAVSVVAECGKHTALSFDIAGGDIVENQRAVSVSVDFSKICVFTGLSPYSCSEFRVNTIYLSSLRNSRTRRVLLVMSGPIFYCNCWFVTTSPKRERRKRLMLSLHPGFRMLQNARTEMEWKIPLRGNVRADYIESNIAVTGYKDS